MFTSIISNPGREAVRVKLCSDVGCLHDACGQRARNLCSVHRAVSMFVIRAISILVIFISIRASGSSL